jgi:hypothetical protein
MPAPDPVIVVVRAWLIKADHDLRTAMEDRTMWRMQDGDRVLTEAEWALFRVGLDALWDYIEDDRKEQAGLSDTGVRVFDALQPEQKLALLADVGQALRDPAIPTPHHTAANEGAIAGVFAMVRQALEQEIDLGAEEKQGETQVRSLLLAAAKDSDEQPEALPALTEEDVEAWDGVLETIEDRIFWDADYEMGDEFLDRPPEVSRELLARMTIDSEYFTAIPREPDEAGLAAVRQSLARLLGRPVPDDEGLYPTLTDLYHDLNIGPCSSEEIGTWSDHPWMEVRYYAEPAWDCDYPTWTAVFRQAVPTAPFDFSAGEQPVPSEAEQDRPIEVQAVQQGDAWVIRDDRGDFWCDVLANGWNASPDEDMPMQTFPSREAAEAAYRQAVQMYREREARHQAALARLGHSDDTAESPAD